MSTKYLSKLLTTGQQIFTDAITAFTGTANEILATNASGFVDTSLIDPAALEDTIDAVVATGTTLVDGDFIAFTAADEIVLADNTAYATRAQGFVLSGFAAGATATVYKSGVNTSVSVTSGDTYFLGVTGDSATTPPAYAVGSICQELGYGTPDGLVFEYDDPTLYAVQP